VDPSAPKTAADGATLPLTEEQLQAIANALQGLDILSQLGFAF
jgi:predicted secreted protein